MHKFFSIVVAAILFASCQNSGVRQTAEPVPSAPATTITPTPPVPGAGQPATVTSTPSAITTTPATNSTSAAGLNPAHGAPGHRCDIAVGAPLNSPPGNAAPSAAGSAPVQMQPQALPQPPANSNARLNPAHGQPGHDCTIPVGQPLKG